MQLEKTELISLYLLLRENESTLDERLVPLLGRIEKLFYKQFSIEEIESLSRDGQNNIDVLNTKL